MSDEELEKGGDGIERRKRGIIIVDVADVERKRKLDKFFED